MRTQAARRDSNELAIKAALEQLGATVVQLSQKGLPDLLIGFRGETYLLEVKTKTGKLTPAQIAFREAWQGKPIVVIRSLEEALEVLGA